MTLRINKLSKRFDDNWALRDVSFEVQNGEILGVFGAAGSGKTTLLNVLAGFEKPEGGTIEYNGRDFTELDRTSRGFSTLPVKERSKLGSLFGSEPPRRCGSAQEQAFNIALSRADTVLLLDNPFCDMDYQMRDANIEKLRAETREKGLAVIFASNDYEEAFLACDRVAVLVNGQVQQEGDPQEIYDKPVSAAVAKVFGPNNLFTARRLSSSKAEQPEFQTLEGEHRLHAEKADLRKLGAINQDVTLAIRPENISISFGASFPEDNLVKATVTEIRPVGATKRIELDANGLQLEAVVLRLVGLNVGDECMVALPPDRIHILKG